MAGTGDAHLRPADEVLLRVENLVVEFPAGRRGQKVHAVTDVSIDVKEGETLAHVGESGCGKSTTGKAIMQLRRLRTQIQMIFQDPISSLNPRRRIEEIISEGLNIWKVGNKQGREAKVDE